jgi:hypothetical protein
VSAIEQWREQSPHLIRQVENWLPLARLESNRLGGSGRVSNGVACNRALGQRNALHV